MAVQNSTAKVQYTLTSAGQTLSVPFYFLENSHLKVISTPIAGTGDETLTLDSDYTASGAGNEAGGSIVMTAGVSGDVVTIKRSVPETQLIDYNYNGRFPSESHEKGLDKLTMILQEQAELLTRAFRLPESATPSEIAAAVIGAGEDGYVFTAGADVSGAPGWAPPPSVTGEVTPYATKTALKAATGLSVGARAIVLGESEQFELTNGAPSEAAGSYQGIELTYAGSASMHWKRIYRGAVRASWFGILADGASDNTSATLALKAALSDGMTVDLSIPGGGTVLMDPIEITSIDNLTFVSNHDTVYKVNDGNISQVFQFTTCDNLRIFGVSIDGNQANESGTDAGTDGGDAGIELYSCNYGVVEYCYVTNTHVRGVKCYGGYGNVIRNCIADTIRGSAFALYTGRDGMILNNIVRNITIDPTFSDAKHAIDIGGQVSSRAQNCRVMGNLLYNLAGSAIQSTNADNTVFSDNQGELIGATILKFDNVTHGSMVNNQFIKGGKYGIFFDGASGIVSGKVTIKDNIIRDLDPSYQQISPTVSGQNIALRKPPPNAKIEGNIFDDCTICVYLDNINSGVEFVGNTFSNASQAINVTSDVSTEEQNIYDVTVSGNRFDTITNPAINANSTNLLNWKIDRNTFIDCGTDTSNDSSGVAILLTANSSGNLITNNSFIGTYRQRSIYQSDTTNGTNNFSNNICEGRPGHSYRFFDDDYNYGTVEGNIQRSIGKIAPGTVANGDSFKFMVPLYGVSPLDVLNVISEDKTTGVTYSVQVAQSTVDESAADTGADTLTITAHPFVDGQYALWNADTGVTGLTDLNYYYIIVVDDDTIQLESTLGGGAVDITAAGTGTGFLRVYDSVTVTATNGSGADVFLGEDVKRRTPLNITTAGSGYVPAHNLSTTTSGSGTGMSVVIDGVDGSGAITSAYVLASGDGYAPGDTVSPSGAAGTGAVFTLRDNALAITDADSGYSTGTNIPVSTSGTGEGMTVNITSVGGSGEITGVAINQLGFGYKSGDTVTPVGGSAVLTFTLSDFAMQIDVLAKINDGESRRVGDTKTIKVVLEHDEISQSSGNAYAFELPRNYAVDSIHSWVQTAFDASTTIEIGSAGDPDLLKTSYAVDNTNRNLFTPANTKVILTGSDLPIFVTKNQATTSGTLYLAFVIRKLI